MGNARPTKRSSSTSGGIPASNVTPNSGSGDAILPLGDGSKCSRDGVLHETPMGTRVRRLEEGRIARTPKDAEFPTTWPREEDSSEAPSESEEEDRPRRLVWVQSSHGGCLSINGDSKCEGKTCPQARARISALGI